MTANEATCALWYWRDGRIGYSLHEDEEEAATFAVSLSDWGDGAPIGVQFADGRTVKLDEWDKYQEVEAAMSVEAARRYAAKKSQPPQKTRVVRDPFEDNNVVLGAEEPSWLGKPQAEES